MQEQPKRQMGDLLSTSKLTGSLKELLDLFPDDEKMNFFIAYIYFKYTNTLVHRLASSMGFATTKNPPKELDPTLELFMQSYLEATVPNLKSVETIPYASKVVKLEDAIQLVTVQESVNLRNLTTVVPFKQANDIVLKNPDSIAVGKCACRLARDNHCEPMGKGLADEKGIECCFFIGDPYASVIAQENPRFRKCSQEEAVEIMKKCHEAGIVQLAFWRKDLNRNFYSICNCCSCCCIGVLAHNLSQGAIPCVQSSGYLASVNTDACSGCSVCVDGCHFFGVSLDEATERAVVDPRKCMGCGMCVSKCPEKAITLVRNPQALEPVDLKVLKQKYGA
ncbi:MAG: 4Fe-4S dicluster domain-containing protein [Candidatus Lindowbacteria bacterium]|nr:4Fe-4S dicluster domain-containing protein [Candidatus Lindowbacteria bacterium]